MQLKKPHLEEELAFLKKVLSVMPGHVYWKNTDGVYLGCNEEQAKIAGFNSSQELVGKTDYDLLPKDEATVLQEIDQQVIRGKKSYSIEEPVTLPNNKKAVFLSHKIPLEDLEGNIIGILGVSIDITERKQMEEDLRKAKEAAERANQVKTDFIRNMEHDLRTPFTGIVNISNGLAKEEKDSVKKEYLTCIHDAANTLLEYCNNIVDFARLETGIPIYEKKFSLPDLIMNLKSLEMPAATEKNLALKMHIENNVPAIVIGDKFRLKRILINLLGNAIKFTKEGAVSLDICLSKKNEKDVILKFIVTDTGMGIPKDIQALVLV